MSSKQENFAVFRLSAPSRRVSHIGFVSHLQESIGGSSLSMYASDYSSWYPLHPTRPKAGIPGVVPANGYYDQGAKDRQLIPAIGDYVNDFRIWQCLGLPDLPLIDDPANTRHIRYSNIMYYANRTDPDFYLGGPTPRMTTHKNSTSSMPILSCKVRDSRAEGSAIAVGHSRSGNVVYWMDDNPSHAAYQVWSMQQVEGACIAFMDGHAEWVPGNELEAVGVDHTGRPWVKAWAVLPEVKT